MEHLTPEYFHREIPVLQEEYENNRIKRIIGANEKIDDIIKGTGPSQLACSKPTMEIKNNV